MLSGIDAMKETTGRRELTIKSEVHDGQLLISVSDTGVGLPAEKTEDPPLDPVEITELLYLG